MINRSVRLVAAFSLLLVIQIGMGDLRSSAQTTIPLAAAEPPLKEFRTAALGKEVRPPLLFNQLRYDDTVLPVLAEPNHGNPTNSTGNDLTNPLTADYSDGSIPAARETIRPKAAPPKEPLYFQRIRLLSDADYFVRPQPYFQTTDDLTRWDELFQPGGTPSVTAWTAQPDNSNNHKRRKTRQPLSHYGTNATYTIGLGFKPGMVSSMLGIQSDSDRARYQPIRDLEPNAPARPFWLVNLDQGEFHPNDPGDTNNYNFDVTYMALSVNF
ncbi:MAG: hypothetical protein HQK58_01715 [Deltaproteobacteria bacterium]|nr:hypothetical protein [Deltaproteobacteria bacterium]